MQTSRTSFHIQLRFLVCHDSDRLLKGMHMYGYWNVYDSNDCTTEDERERYRKSGMSWGHAVPLEHCHSFDKRK